MKPDFYDAYFRAVADSPIHSAFCRHVFGIDLCQHGFADLNQLNLAIRTAPIQQHHAVLDVGCGCGMIAEYLSERTGACLTGIDNAAAAVDAALWRTTQKRAHLVFALGDINDLHLEPATFDVILLIDSIYFSTDYDRTISGLRRSLKAGGCILTFYSIGPALMGRRDFPKELLEPQGTPLALSFDRNGFVTSHHDLTSQDYELARKRKAFLREHAEDFQREGVGFIYENRLGDSTDFMEAIESGLHKRFLYCSRVGQGT